MGCSSSKHHAPPPHPAGKGKGKWTVNDAVHAQSMRDTMRMKKSLELVKGHIEKQTNDTTMMNKLLELMCSTMTSSIKKKEFREYMSFALAPLHIDYQWGGGATLTKPKLAKEFKNRGLKRLMVGSRLRQCQDIRRNFLDCSAIFEEMKIAKNMADELLEMDRFEAEMDDRPKKSRRGVKGKTEKEVSEANTVFNEHRSKMLRVLEPLFYMMHHFPEEVWLDEDFSLDQLKVCKMKVGRAVLAIKTAVLGQESRWAAFIGPESVGKSTAINYSVSRGQGEKFMPSKGGECTMACCFITNGPKETLRKGLDDPPQVGPVHEALAQIWETLKDGGEVGQMTALDVFCATKSFEPPGGTGLIDVPGIRKGHEINTALALGIASVLVLCVPEIDRLENSLRQNGSLELLPLVVNSLERPLPIHILVTRGPSPQEFKRIQERYKTVIRTHFPKSPCVLSWFNLGPTESPTIQPEGKREALVNQFYATTNQFKPTMSDPYGVFQSVEEDVQIFTSHCSKKFEDELLGYSIKFSRAVENEMKNTLSDIQHEIQAGHVVKNEISDPGNLVDTVLDNLLVEPTSVFSVVIAERILLAPHDPLLLAQELVFETRGTLVRWLTERGDGLHQRTIGRVVDSIVEPYKPTFLERQNEDRRKQFWTNYRREVCDKLIDSIEFASKMQASRSQDTGESDAAAASMPAAVPAGGGEGGTNPINSGALPEDDLERKSHADSISQLGHFFKRDAFPWVMAGFYLLSTDEFIKHTLMKEFTTKQATKNHFADFSVSVKGLLNDKNIPYRDWVKRVKKHKELKDQIEEIFKVLPVACNKFVEILNHSCLLCPDNRNTPLNQLLRLTYECVQRIFVRYRTRPSPGETDYTILGHKLKDAGQGREEFDDVIERIRRIKDAQGMDRLVDLCTQLLEMVRSQKTDKMSSYDQSFREMEATVENMSVEANRFKIARAFKDGSRRSVMLVTGMQRSADAQGDTDTDLASLFDSAAPTPESAPSPLSGTRPQAVAADLGTRGRSLGLSEMQPWEKVEVDSSDGENMLEVLAGQLQGRTEKYEVHEPPAKIMEYTTYASDVVCELRRKACRVMVLLRRMDPLSATPDDMEVEILKKINEEAGLSKCIVVWASAPPGQPFSDAEESDWKKFAPELNLSLVRVASPADLSTFFNDLDVALADSSSTVRTAVDRKQDQLQNLAKKVTHSCRVFQQKRKDLANKSAGEFSMDFAENDIKVLYETLLGELPETLTKEWIDSNAEFQIPTTKNLRGNMEFRPVGSLYLSDDGQARDINELQCRNHLLLVMLGQTVKKAADLAERAYDKVILPILDKVAECFCMDRGKMLLEVENFCKSDLSDADDSFFLSDKKEMKKEKEMIAILREFISRDHFMQMYVGCVVALTMPMLYTAVLPVIMERPSEETPGQQPRPSDKQYKAFIDHAKAHLNY